MAETATIHPLGLEVARSFLLDAAPVTDLVGQRISRLMPKQDVVPRFPALRLTDTLSVVVIARRWVHMSLQIDCWGTTQMEADRVATTVVGELQESANWTGEGAVLGEAEDLRWRQEPDRTLNPTQARSIITCHLPIRPNP